jgi:glycosyltransferase involved in cell wall biosynthesis
MPQGGVVVTNDFWMPALLPWLKPSAGKVVVNANRFPKKQYWLYSKCAAFAAVSESVARGIREQSPSIVGKVTVVPNCVDAVFLEKSKGLKDDVTAGGRRSETGDRRQVAQQPTDTRQQDNGTTRRPVRILFVGRIHPEKGLELLAQALKSMEWGAWECVLVGPVAEAEGGGGEAFLARIRELTRGLPVTIEAPIYGLDRLAAFYSTGDILVYPSIAELGEAMPLAPLEGMARGLVPVVSDIAAFREYLEPEVNGIVFNHRNGQGPGNLARVLNDLVTDADKRARLGAAARATAEKFSPAAIADKYLQLFEKVISGT